MMKKWGIACLVSLALIAGCKKNAPENDANAEMPDKSAGQTQDIGDNMNANDKDGSQTPDDEISEDSQPNVLLRTAFEKAKKAAENNPDAEETREAAESFLAMRDRYKKSYEAHRAEVREFFETQLRSRDAFKNGYIYYLRAADAFDSARGDFSEAARRADPWVAEGIASGDDKALNAFLRDVRLGGQERAYEALRKRYEAKTQTSGAEDFDMARQTEFAPYSEKNVARRQELLGRAAAKGSAEAKCVLASEALAANEDPDSGDADPQAWAKAWKSLEACADGGNPEAMYEVSRRIVAYKKYAANEFGADQGYPFAGRLAETARGEFEASAAKYGNAIKMLQKYVESGNKNGADLTEAMAYLAQKNEISENDFRLYYINRLAKRPDIAGCADIDNYLTGLVRDEGTVKIENNDAQLSEQYEKLGDALAQCYKNLMAQGLDYGDEIEGSAAYALGMLYKNGNLPFVKKNLQKAKHYIGFAARRGDAKAIEEEKNF